MNLVYLNQYVLFAAVTVLIGLILCEIICHSYPEMDKNNTNTQKYTCIIILAITGLAMRWLITTRVGERYLYSEAMDRSRREAYRLRKETKSKILNYVKKIEELNKIKIPTLPPLPENTEQIEPVESPPVESPPVEQPPVEQPPLEQPPLEQPALEQQNSEEIAQQEDSDNQPAQQQEMFRKMRR